MTKRIIDTCLLLSFIAVVTIVVVQSFAADAFADTNSAAIAYRSNTGTDGLNSAKYREWNPSTLTWGSTVELPKDTTTSNIRFAWLEFSPISSKRVLVTLQDDGTLDSYVCAASCTTTTNWMIEKDFADLWAAAPAGSDRPFDIEFEKTTGNLMIVYDKVSSNNSQDLFYRTMIAGDAYFGTEGTIDDTTAAAADTVYSFIRMDSRKTANANEITMIAQDQTNQDAIAWVWTGSTWGNQHQLTTGVGTGTAEAIGVGYETNSGHVIIVAGEGTSMRYNQFSSGAWGISTTFGTTNIGQIDFVTVKSDPVSTSNAIFVAEVGSSNDIDSQYWSGVAWTDHAEHDSGVNGHISRVLDFAWDNTASRGVLIWATTSGQLDFKRFSGSNTFSARSSFVDTSTHPWVQLSDIPNPTAADTVSSLGATLDATFDIGGIRWNGALSNPVSTGDGGITSDTTVTTYENFKVAWQRSSAAPSWAKTSGEGLGLSDSQGKIPDKKMYENLGLSDTFQSIAVFIRQLNEAVALSDVRTFSASRRIDENLGISDSKIFSLLKSTPESLRLIDAHSNTVAFEKTLAENLGSGDQLVKDTVRIALENVGFNENVVAGRNFGISISENLELDITHQLLRDFGVSINENLELDGVMASATDFLKSFAEEIALADVTYTTTYVQLLMENLAVEYSTVTNTVKNLNEAVSAGEVLDLGALFIESFVENLGAAETVTAEVGKSASENLTLAENINTDIDKSLSESAAFTDGLAEQIGKSVMESIDLVDSSSFSKGFASFISENLAVSDISSTASEFALSFLENIAMTDSFNSFFETLNISLTETIEMGDGISDIFMDVYLDLTESLAMVTSFFTPEVAYQSTLVSEDLEVSDKVEFDGQLNISTTLNENIGIGDSAIFDKESVTDNDDLSGDSTRRKQHGSDRDQHSRVASESVGVSDSLSLSRSIEIFPTQSLSVGETGTGNNAIKATSTQDRPDVKISVALDTASTVFRIVPQAIGSATFEIMNNASSPQHVVLHYRIVDQKDGNTLVAKMLQLDLQAYQSRSEKAEIPFNAAGKYTLVVNVESTDGNNLDDQTTSIDITVPWLVVFLSLILKMHVFLTAVALGFHYWNVLIAHNSKGKMSGDRF